MACCGQNNMRGWVYVAVAPAGQAYSDGQREKTFLTLSEAQQYVDAHGGHMEGRART